MGVCIGGKWCRTQECKNRCKGWFGAQPEIERSCKNACKVNSSLKRDDFLCSGEWIDQRVVMSAYGYDPCENDSIIMTDLLDPMGEHKAEEEQNQNNNRIILIILGVIIVSIVGLLTLKLFK
jgi:hypothetical protein